MTVRVALVGRPNAGKSSVYNALTGGHAKVGNFPGITVDIMEAEVDLPSGTRARVADSRASGSCSKRMPHAPQTMAQRPIGVSNSV